MKLLLAGAALAAVGLAISITPCHACGDKFLVQGRSQGYYRMHLAARPAAILIYRGATSAAPTEAQKSKIEDALRQAGHRVAVCGVALDCDMAVSAGGYDIVMANLSDAPAIAEKLRAGSSRAVVVPIAQKAEKARFEKAKSDYGFVYESHSSTGKLLTLIDEVMTRQGRTATAATTN